MMVLMVVVFLILFLVNYFSEKQDSSSITWNDIYEHILWVLFRPIDTPRNRPPSSRSSLQQSSSCSSKGEEMCKTFIEFYFQKPFHKIRPEFLRNPVTGENLELDLYNSELRLAIEYNGSQHYQYNSFMHKNSRDKFQNQQYRDLIKKDLCGKANITLIIVPYTVPHDKIGSFLFDELKKLGFSPHYQEK